MIFCFSQVPKSGGPWTTGVVLIGTPIDAPADHTFGYSIRLQATVGRL